MPLVFVYGTLKRGHALNAVFTKDDKFLGRAYTVNEQFDLFSNGNFPYMWKGKYRVRGELYDVTYKTMETLNHIEGVPHHYQQVFPYVAFECEGAKAEAKACAFMAAKDYNFYSYSRKDIGLEEGTNAVYWRD